MNDGDGSTSLANDATVTVSGVNDAPVVSDLAGDSLADVRNTPKIAAVVAGRVLYPRQELDRMLAGVGESSRRDERQ